MGQGEGSGKNRPTGAQADQNGLYQLPNGQQLQQQNIGSSVPQPNQQQQMPGSMIGHNQQPYAYVMMNGYNNYGGQLSQMGQMNGFPQSSIPVQNQPSLPSPIGNMQQQTMIPQHFWNQMMQQQQQQSQQQHQRPEQQQSQASQQQNSQQDTVSSIGPTTASLFSGTNFNKHQRLTKQGHHQYGQDPNQLGNNLTLMQNQLFSGSNNSSSSSTNGSNLMNMPNQQGTNAPRIENLLWQNQPNNNSNNPTSLQNANGPHGVISFAGAPAFQNNQGMNSITVNSSGSAIPNNNNNEMNKTLLNGGSASWAPHFSQASGGQRLISSSSSPDQQNARNSFVQGMASLESSSEKPSSNHDANGHQNQQSSSSFPSSSSSSNGGPSATLIGIQQKQQQAPHQQSSPNLNAQMSNNLAFYKPGGVSDNNSQQQQPNNNNNTSSPQVIQMPAGQYPVYMQSGFPTSMYNSQQFVIPMGQMGQMHYPVVYSNGHMMQGQGAFYAVPVPMGFQSYGAADDEKNEARRERKRSSKYRGVSWHKRGKKWIARIWINGKSEHLGVYSSEVRAALAVDLRLLELGESSQALNFPDPTVRKQLLDSFKDNKSESADPSVSGDVSDSSPVLTAASPTAVNTSNNDIENAATQSEAKPGVLNHKRRAPSSPSNLRKEIGAEELSSQVSKPAKAEIPSADEN